MDKFDDAQEDMPMGKGKNKGKRIGKRCGDCAAKAHARRIFGQMKAGKGKPRKPLGDNGMFGGLV